jgi:poly-gamma-glutamate capsule biosynthesis protein CapA/YwtB (metallophosphatase superfamily)
VSLNSPWRTTEEGEHSHLRPAAHWVSAAIVGLLLVALVGCKLGADLDFDRAGQRPASVIRAPTPEPERSVTLAMLGDVMLGRSVQPSTETFAYLQPFLTSADLALANLESPLTGADASTQLPYVLCAPPEYVSYLIEAGFDLFSLANNHRLDCGEEGFSETQHVLMESGLGFVGPAPEPVYRQINGLRLAFLAFDATREFHPESATQAIRSARQTGALVVVSIHWGEEYQAGVSTYQRQIAGQLAEGGAVLIWGHHPHVLQSAEWIQGGKTLVLYSLGNALFDQYGLENTRQSALALVRLGQDGVEELQAIPFVIDVLHSRLLEADPASIQVIMGYFK